MKRINVRLLLPGGIMRDAQVEESLALRLIGQGRAVPTAKEVAEKQRKRREMHRVQTPEGTETE